MLFVGVGARHAVPHRHQVKHYRQAAIGVDSILYDETDVTIKKAAVAPYITTELIEDQQFDWIELELMRAGAKLENRLNREAITTMLDAISMTNDIDPAAHMDVLSIGLTKKEVDHMGWCADSMFIEPYSYAYLIDEAVVGPHMRC